MKSIYGTYLVLAFVGIMEGESNIILVVICETQDAGVFVVSAFQSFSNICQVKTEVDCSITTISFEEINSELEGNEGDMRGVHSLKTLELVNLRMNAIELEEIDI